MKATLLNLLLGLLIYGSFIQLNAQDVITFDVNSKKQILKNLETWSEVNMYHPLMSPTPSDLVKDINTHNYTLCLKSDVEQTNDNSDPYVTDFSKFKPQQGGKAGVNMAAYFPYIREYKRLRDSMVAVNPALKPFSLGIRPGFYDRYIMDWLKTSATGTSLVDSTRYAEFAENIYAQCIILKDSTGVDVTAIDPIPINNGSNITSTNLCKLIDTLGVYLEKRGLHPALGFGSFFDLVNTSNQTLLFKYITKVFNDPIAKKYVKFVNAEYSFPNGPPSDAFFIKLADTAKKYGFDITIALTSNGARNQPWQWTDGLNFASRIPQILNIAKANKIMLQYHVNFETAFAMGMISDTIVNGLNLDHPLRKTTALKTEQYYLFGHLFRHTNAGSTYVLTSSSTNANIVQAVVYDTISKKTTVFLINKGTAVYTAKLSYDSYNPGTYDVYRCSATEVDYKLASINASDNIILPPQSATVLTNDYVSSLVNNLPAPDFFVKTISPYSVTLAWGNKDTRAIANDVYEGATKLLSSYSRYSYYVIAGLEPGKSYSFTTKSRDVYGNYSPVSNTITITTPVVTKPIRESWADCNGAAEIAGIPFTSAPTEIKQIDSLCYKGEPGNTGKRIRGYIVPPASGKYRFFLASCDYGEFYLSSDSLPANKTKKAYFTTWNTCPSNYGWTEYAGQMSDTVVLVAGTKYYFEILHASFWRGSSLQVAWTGPMISSITVLRTPYIKPYILKTQTITFNALTPKNVGDSTFTLNATSSEGLPITYSSNNLAVAQISGNTVTIIGAGIADITASQVGDNNCMAAKSIIQTLTVYSGGKTNQSITFGSLASKTISDAAFTLNATASSGLTVSYSSSNLSVATIVGNTVSIVGVGTTTITASQSGNASYNAATNITQDFVVTVGTGLEEEENIISVSPNPVKNFSQLTVKSSTGNIVSIYNTSGIIIFSETMNADEIKINTENFSSGIYFIHVKTGNKMVVVKCIVI